MKVLPASRGRERSLPWRSSLYLNSFYLMAANVANAAFGFLFWTAAARLYRPEEAGLTAAAGSAIGLLSVLSTLGLDQAMVRFVPSLAEPQGIINSSLTLELAGALLLGLGFLAGLELWSPVLLPLRRDPLTAASLVVATVCATGVGLLASAFLAWKRAGLGLAQSLVSNIARIALAVAFAASRGTRGLMGGGRSVCRPG